MLFMFSLIQSKHPYYFTVLLRAGFQTALSYLCYLDSRPHKVWSELSLGLLPLVLLVSLTSVDEAQIYFSYSCSHIAVVVHAERCGLCPLVTRLSHPFQRCRRKVLARGQGLFCRTPYTGRLQCPGTWQTSNSVGIVGVWF